MRKQHNHEPGQLRTPLRDVPISDRVNLFLVFFAFFWEEDSYGHNAAHSSP